MTSITYILTVSLPLSNTFPLISPVKPGSVGSRKAACTEMLQRLPWTGSTSLSLVQTTVEDMEIASLESVSVIWDTQVQ